MVVCCEHYMLGDIVCPEPYYYCVWEGGKNCDDAVYVSEVCRMEGWLIGVITTVCALVLCACIGCIYCCCFRRPRAKQSVIVVGGAGAAAASASANTTTVIDTAPLLQHTPTQVGAVAARRRRQGAAEGRSPS